MANPVTPDGKDYVYVRVDEMVVTVTEHSYDVAVPRDALEALDYTTVEDYLVRGQDFIHRKLISEHREITNLDLMDERLVSDV